ncbi:MAG: autotransporter-associated beta strand repeat-containing protein [Verrucomicrobia bacterium]|nr:autotransporter-associated beta strand repeat-containing protein [Verrucomicrobiota bacterium]
MKTPLFRSLNEFLILAALLAAPVALAANTNGTWITDGNGLWSDADTANWSAGTVADGSGFTADFSTIDLTADRTVSLAAARSIGNLVFGDFTITTAAGWVLDNNVTPANIMTLAGTTPTITVHALGTGKSASISAKIDGTAGLTKAGAGTLALSGANTYSGGTVINGGTVQIGSDTNLGTVPGAVDAANISLNNGGKLVLGDGTNQPNLVANRGITLGAGMQGFVKWSRKSATVNGVIAGSGGLNYDDNTASGADGGGGGRYQINGANTYTGDTTITFKGIKDPGVFLNNKLAMQHSTLDYNTTNATSGTDLIWFNGGATNYTDGFTLGGLKGNKNLNLSPQGNTAKNLKIGNNGQDTSHTGIISSSNDASAGLTKIGAGILTLTNANTYSGTTKVEAGTLKLTHNNGIQSSAFDTTGAGTLDITFLTTPTVGGLIGGTTLPLHAGITALTLNPKAGLVATYAGDLSSLTATMPLTKTGAGTQVLSGTNSTKQFTLATGGTGTLQVDTLGAVLTLSSVINGNGGDLAKTGAGTLALAGVNTYTGATTVAAGTLTLGVAGSITTSSGVILKPGTLLDTSAKTAFAIPAAQPLTLHVDGTASGSCGRIMATGLDITNAVVVFIVDNPLDDPVYILADYTPPLTGAAFASVTPPLGYTIDYAPHGGTQIALVATGGPVSAYDTWATAKGLTGANNGATQDPDNDGRTNLQEFAFDGNPLSGANDGKLVGKLATVGAETHGFTLTVPMRSGTVCNGPGDLVSDLIDGVIYRIQGSDDLIDHTTMNVTEVSPALNAGLPALSAGWTYRTFRTPGTVTESDASDFLRAGVAAAP